jgi:hypothetical protein
MRAGNNVALGQQVTCADRRVVPAHDADQAFFE